MSFKTNSILNYFQKSGSTPLKPLAKVTSLTPKASPTQGQSRVAKGSTPKEVTTVPLDEREASNSDSDGEARASVGCFGDGPSNKKRKRIRVLASSSESEGCDDSPPSSPCKLRASSSKLKTKNSAEKENVNGSTPVLQKRLSEFASPALKKPKLNLDESKTEVDDAEECHEASGKSEPSSWAHLSYSFLDKKNIRDKNRCSPDDPQYDPTTLFVPDSFLKDQTPAQRQWWEIKSNQFDSVLFFKMGKFYELFHMDAVIGVQKCGLLMMKKEIAHCGFPETALKRNTDILIELGFKVTRIEQTETPSQMTERCAQMSRPSKFDKVVKREVCQVASMGTRTNTTQSEPQFLTAVSAEKSPGKIAIGIAFVDTSIGLIHIGQFDDDSNLSRLETLLAVYPPVEILCDKGKSFPGLDHSLRKVCPNSLQSFPFPQPKKTLKTLLESDYFGSKGSTVFEAWPKELVTHLDEGDALGQMPKPESSLAISALGGVVTYLQTALIDEYILSMKNFKTVNPIDTLNGVSNEDKGPQGSTMILDQKSLKNLDIVSTNGQASLFTVLDKTSTAMGKRLLYTWACMPLLSISEIEDRQKAIQYLNSRPKLVEDVRAALKGIPDIEKLLSAIHVAGVKLSPDHPESRAVYYEQAAVAKAKISRLVNCLEGLSAIDNLVFTIRDEMSENTTKILNNLILKENGGNFEDISDDLNFFEKAFNQKDALSQGKIVPKKGVDDEYDRVQQLKSEFEDEKFEYLKSQKKFFGTNVVFWGSGNQAFQLEVPEQSASRATNHYTMSSQKKGFKRFTTLETRDFFKQNQSIEEEEALALGEVSRKIFSKFCERRKVWETSFKAIAQLDALLCLHDYSFGLEFELSCFPKFTLKTGKDKPFLKFESGRHPIVIATNPSLSFIPNDFELDDRLSILTGANMGGKSTLMRQTALLCVLAQMGCKVPAASMELSPIDRIFTRIGAADNIFDRESTFMVELSETGIILKHANRHSLVLIDELGRGTTTFDGCAIAYGVSKYLALRGCRTLFSTHYHELMREYVDNSNVAIYHMSVMEQEPDEENDSAIVFLYTVAPGPCSKSHGFNAARLAGLPEPIIDRALKVACQFEEEQNNLIELTKLLSQC